MSRVGKVVPRRSLATKDDVAIYAAVSYCHNSRAKVYCMHKAKNAMERALSQPDDFPVVRDARPYLEARVDGTCRIFRFGALAMVH